MVSIVKAATAEDFFTAALGAKAVAEPNRATIAVVYFIVLLNAIKDVLYESLEICDRDVGF